MTVPEHNACLRCTIAVVLGFEVGVNSVTGHAVLNIKGSNCHIWFLRIKGTAWTHQPCANDSRNYSGDNASYPLSHNSTLSTCSTIRLAYVRMRIYRHESKRKCA